HLVARVEGLGAHRPGQEVDDRVAALERVTAAAVRRDRIFGEQPGDLVPELQVQAPRVRVLQPLDGFELDQILRRHGRGGYDASPTTPSVGDVEQPQGARTAP